METLRQTANKRSNKKDEIKIKIRSINIQKKLKKNPTIYKSAFGIVITLKPGMILETLKFLFISM